jgi:hypothetical protein
MKSRLTEKQIRRFYRLLSTPMTRFNCGRLCAPANGGIPLCCDRSEVIPILFLGEFRWHRARSRFWKRTRPRNRGEKKLMDEATAYTVFAECPGVKDCRRSLRALVCRLYPFEPYVAKDGHVKGLVYSEGARTNDACPLIGRKRNTYRGEYIRNAIQVWSEILASIPEEQELYYDESRKLDRKYRRKKTPLLIFR